MDNPVYMGAALAEKFEITTDVALCNFVVSKQLIFYRVDEENSTIEISAYRRDRQYPKPLWLVVSLPGNTDILTFAKERK